MLNGFEQIVDSINPNAVLYKWRVGKDVQYAIDVYKPRTHGDFSKSEILIAYESAMGYRLRYLEDPDDIMFIPPEVIDNGDIKRLLTQNKEAIIASQYPLQIGFMYDGNPPNEGSEKNLNEILKWCSNNNISVLISTAYTATNTLRSTLKEINNRFFSFDIRIPHMYGVNNPTLSQIAYNIFRLSKYGNMNRFYFSLLCFGFDYLNVQKFWEQILNTPKYEGGGFSGARLLVPEYPLVSNVYISLLHTEINKKEKVLFNAEHFDDNFVKQSVLSSWLSGRSIEVFNHTISTDKNLSDNMLRKGEGFGLYQNMRARMPENKLFVNNANPYERHAEVIEENIGLRAMDVLGIQDEREIN